MSRMTIVVGITCVALVAVVHDAVAQTPPPPAAPRRLQRPGAGLRGQTVPPPLAGLPEQPSVPPAELERWFDAYVTLQAQDALKLNDTQYPPFVSRLRVLHQMRRRHAQERRRVVQELARLTGPGVAFDEAKVKERMAALLEIDVRSGDDVRKAYEGIDQVLDLRQRARFRVFEDQVERRKIDLLLRARRLERRQQATPRASPPR